MILTRILKKIKRKFYDSPKQKYKLVRYHTSIGKLITNKSIVKNQVNVRDLVIHLFNEESEFLRMDTVVRYLAIEQYNGKNDVGYALYNKMQTTRMGDKGMAALDHFKQLIKNIQSLGYSDSSFITINRKGYLKDGSHRLAYAIYSGKTNLPALFVEDEYSVDYSINWFKENNFSKEDIRNIENGFQRIKEKLEVSFPIILWGSVADHFDEITERLQKKFTVFKSLDINFKSKESYFNTIKSIYSVDSISDWKVEKKISYLKEYPTKARIISVDVPNPDYRYKGNGRVISRTMEIEKKSIREVYKDKVPQYFYDIIVHIGDNYDHSKYIFDLMGDIIKLPDYFNNIEELSYFMIKKEVPYQTSDFPISFCLGKDIDLIVEEKDFEELCKETVLYFNKFKNTFTIKIEDNKNRYKLRLELESRLVLQIDINISAANLPHRFIERCFDNIENSAGVNLLTQAYEYFIRKAEVQNNPLKKHHYEFIQKTEDSAMNKIEEIKEIYSELKTLFDS